MRKVVDTIREELVNYHGQSMVPHLVVAGAQLWLRKPNASWPEILGYRLAGSWLNIPETIPGTLGKGAITLDGEPALFSEQPLIRVAQTLGLDELPIRTLDQAIAGELAYSVWIRRRDPSYWNRVYVEGVPVFFDHHIAFGVESDHRSLDGFRAPGSDGGYPSQWRRGTVGRYEIPTTMGERALPRHVTVHRVREPEIFETHLDWTVQRITAISDIELDRVVRGAGAPPVVALWLAQWRDELPVALQRLRSMLRSFP